MLGREPAGPGTGEIVGDEASLGTGIHRLPHVGWVADRIGDVEADGADRCGPQPDPHGGGPEHERGEIFDLVPADDDAGIEHPHVPEPLLDRNDPGVLEQPEVLDIVDVAIGVHIAPPERDVDGEGFGHGAIGHRRRPLRVGLVPLDDTDPMHGLLRLLDLAEVGEARIAVSGAADAIQDAERGMRVFVGPSQRTPQERVFGGQVLAQCVIAAGRTVADVAPTRRIHSLHGYFIRPGDDKHPIRFAVESLRDGNSFSTRRVHALQHGHAILSMITSFQEPAVGLDHQDPMPDVAPPEEVEPWPPAVGEEYAEWRRRRLVELRHVEGHLFRDAIEPVSASQHVWMKTIAPLPDDPLLHAAVLAFASDYTLLEGVLRRHGLGWTDPRLRVASLDHAMWFHRPARADEWLLYAEHSPSAQGGRGLGRGRMYARDGVLVASVAQEGMVRVKGE